MKKMIYTLALVLGLGAISQVQAIELENAEGSYALETKAGNALSGAYFYADQIQLGIAPHDVVKLTKIGTSYSRKFDLSPSGGFIVPFRGNALYVNGQIVPETAFSGTSTTPISGSLIVYLNRNDDVTIRNIETAKTFNTMIPASTYVPTIPVSVAVQLIDN